MQTPTGDSAGWGTREAMETQHGGSSGSRKVPPKGMILRGPPSHGARGKEEATGSRGSVGTDQGKIIPSLPCGAGVAVPPPCPQEGLLGPWQDEMSAWPLTVLLVRLWPGLRGWGGKGAYFNFLLGPPHDKGEISPNIIISQKNTLWNHKKGNTVEPEHRGCP